MEFFSLTPISSQERLPLSAGLGERGLWERDWLDSRSNVGISLEMKISMRQKRAVSKACIAVFTIKGDGRDPDSCEIVIVSLTAFQAHVSTKTSHVPAGVAAASVQKILYGCFKIVLKAVKCVHLVSATGPYNH